MKRRTFLKGIAGAAAIAASPIPVRAMGAAPAAPAFLAKVAAAEAGLALPAGVMIHQLRLALRDGELCAWMFGHRLSDHTDVLSVVRVKGEFQEGSLLSLTDASGRAFFAVALSAEPTDVFVTVPFLVPHDRPRLQASGPEKGGP